SRSVPLTLPPPRRERATPRRRWPSAWILRRPDRPVMAGAQAGHFGNEFGIPHQSPFSDLPAVRGLFSWERRKLRKWSIWPLRHARAGWRRSGELGGGERQGGEGQDRSDVGDEQRPRLGGDLERHAGDQVRLRQQLAPEGGQ